MGGAAADHGLGGHYDEILPMCRGCVVFVFELGPKSQPIL